MEDGNKGLTEGFTKIEEGKVLETEVIGGPIGTKG